MSPRRPSPPALLVALALLALVAPPRTLAVGTSRWVHTSEADFRQGTARNVVATNFGELKLSRAVKTLMEQNPKVSAVNALAEAPDGTLYAGTAPNGVILQLKDDKVTPFATLEDGGLVFSMRVDAKGNLLVGTGGEKGRVYRIDRETAKPTEVFSAEGVQYVWALAETPDGMLYAATGPTGQLYEIGADGQKSLLYDSTENNLLSIATDGKDLLFVGTDPNGLVYRVNRKSREVFVVFDAPESEVRALVRDAKGNLYAGTAEASETAEAAAARAAAAAAPGGRPEGRGVVPPIPAPPPSDPKPPVLPDPNPGEPAPIPKHKASLFFMDDPALDAQVLADAPATAPGTLPAPRDDAAPLAPRRPAPPTRARVVPPAPAGQKPVDPNAAGQPKPQGNAIYRIEPTGFVTEIFRQNVLVLSIVEKDGTLLVGTGSDGLVYQIDPAAEETVVIAKVDAKQVTAMLPARDGRVILGLANAGSLAAMSSGFAQSGTYTSPVLDATQISRFGKAHLRGTLPKGSGLTLATRSGNVKDPNATGWSKWSPDTSATEFVPVAAPSARFLQYRLTFASKDGADTAAVEEVDIAYQVPNVAPVVRSIRSGFVAKPEDAAAAAAATASGGRAPAPKVRTIAWEAADPNADTLEYNLYFRRQGQGNWILLKENFTQATFEWDTRTVPDGRYELKVIASDGRSNPKGEAKTASRVSDAVVIDNTPPVIGNLKAQVAGRSVRIEALAADRMGTITTLEYSVDSKDNWQAVLPSDKIFDSPEEAVSFAIDALSPGSHQVMLRALDDRGNAGFESVSVTIPAPTAKKPENQ